MSQTLGIDIGGTSIKTALLSNGRTLWTSTSAPYSMPDRKTLIEAIRQTIQQPPENLRGVGLCTPGALDLNQRRITIAVNVPGLLGITLDELIHQALAPFAQQPTVHLLNDAQAAAYDIYATRRLSGRILTLVLGTGVGAAVLDEGRPLQFVGLEPGHIGQLDVSLTDDPPIGPDGGAGGLEGYFGVAALTRDYGDTRRALAEIKPSDPAFRALVRAMRICHAMFVPDHIILAGGLGIRMGHLIEPLMNAVNTHLTSVAKPDWTLSLADHDFHAATGAARWAEDGRNYEL